MPLNPDKRSSDLDLWMEQETGYPMRAGFLPEQRREQCLPRTPFTPQRKTQRMAKVVQLASFLTIPTCTLSAMHSRSSLNLHVAVLQAPMPAIR